MKFHIIFDPPPYNDVKLLSAHLYDFEIIGPLKHLYVYYTYMYILHYIV